MEALVNEAWLCYFVILRSDKGRIHFHFEVCLVELEAGCSQVHVEQASEHFLREIEVLAICCQYLVEARNQRRLELRQERVKLMHVQSEVPLWLHRFSIVGIWRCRFWLTKTGLRDS